MPDGSKRDRWLGGVFGSRQTGASPTSVYSSPEKVVVGTMARQPYGDGTTRVATPVRNGSDSTAHFGVTDREKALLNSKNEQIRDLERQLESSNRQLREAQRNSSTSTQLDTENKWLRRELKRLEDIGINPTTVAQLQSELSELRNIIVSKEKQIAILKRVDPNMSDVSAVQLGAEAIMMVQSSIELRKELSTLEAQLGDTRSNLKSMHEKYEDVSDKLDKSRRENAGLLEVIAERDINIAQLESSHSHKIRTMMENREKLETEMNKLRGCVKELELDVSVAKKQAAKMKQELGLRDEKIIVLQGEVVRGQDQLESLNKSLKKLSGEHSELQRHLHNATELNEDREIYLAKLEKKVKSADIKQHRVYMDEVMKNQRLEFDITQAQKDRQNDIHSRDNQIADLATALHAKNARLKTVKGALEQVMEFDDTSSAGRGRRVYRAVERKVEQRERYTSRDQQRPRVRNAEKIVDERSSFGEREAPPLATLDKIFGDYSPHHGDAIDEAVASYLNKTDSRLRHMICRLSPGVYLLGTQRVRVRLDGNTLQVEDTPDMWKPLSSVAA